VHDKLSRSSKVRQKKKGVPIKKPQASIYPELGVPRLRSSSMKEGVNEKDDYRYHFREGGEVWRKLQKEALR